MAAATASSSPPAATKHRIRQAVSLSPRPLLSPRRAESEVGCAHSPVARHIGVPRPSRRIRNKLWLLQTCVHPEEASSSGVESIRALRRCHTKTAARLQRGPEQTRQGRSSPPLKESFSPAVADQTGRLWSIRQVKKKASGSWLVITPPCLDGGKAPTRSLVPAACLAGAGWWGPAPYLEPSWARAGRASEVARLASSPPAPLHLQRRVGGWPAQPGDVVTTGHCEWCGPTSPLSAPPSRGTYSNGLQCKDRRPSGPRDPPRASAPAVVRTAVSSSRHPGDDALRLPPRQGEVAGQESYHPLTPRAPIKSQVAAGHGHAPPRGSCAGGPTAGSQAKGGRGVQPRGPCPASVHLLRLHHWASPPRREGSCPARAAGPAETPAPPLLPPAGPRSGAWPCCSGVAAVLGAGGPSGLRGDARAGQDTSLGALNRIRHSHTWGGPTAA